MFLEKLLTLLQIKNINKAILFLLFFLYSCSNFDFVYKNNGTGNEISITEILITGSSDDIIIGNVDGGSALKLERWSDSVPGGVIQAGSADRDIAEDLFS